MDSTAPEIVEALQVNQLVCLEAPPGYTKTTRVPATRLMRAFSPVDPGVRTSAPGGPLVEPASGPRIRPTLGSRGGFSGSL